ncbi:hypothetical protein Tsubulata_030431 [Turnera subulata]|uniref:F-box domain-containing protein n=1 Tax=Turnera subulata TaxID=218843 RepID=A0A9Q0JIH1_9ROSI|nr:hypothetical protein Tsubulata_030431 [Turnera subulata]
MGRRPRTVVEHRWWSDLSRELLEMIVNCLQNNYLDVLRFRAVCRSWRRSSTPLPRAIPSLGVPPFVINDDQKYQVEKLDETEGKWVRPSMEELKRHLLFAGYGGSFSLMASDFPEYSTNCIHITRYGPAHCDRCSGDLLIEAVFSSYG